MGDRQIGQILCIKPRDSDPVTISSVGASEADCSDGRQGTQHGHCPRVGIVGDQYRVGGATDHDRVSRHPTYRVKSEYKCKTSIE